MNHPKTKTLTLILILIFICACRNGNPRIKAHFDAVEQIIESDPCEAMKMLRDSRRWLSCRSEEARYALLMSMAMDMADSAYTSDSLINVAVNYYKRHGSADERLKSYYYKGVAYDNANDYENEMRCLLDAEEFIPQTTDHISAGRVYAAFAAIYNHWYDLEKEKLYIKKAEEQYKLAGDSNRCARTMLKLANIYIRCDKPDSAKLYIDAVYSQLGSLNQTNISSYYENKLIFDRYYGGDIGLDLEDYLTSCDDKNIIWTQVASSYTHIGEFKKALEALDKFVTYNQGCANVPLLYLSRAAIYDSLGQYKQCYHAYKEYVRITDEQDMALFAQDAVSLKDKSEQNKTIRRGDIRTLALMAIAVLTLICIAILSLRFKKTVNAKDIEFDNCKNLLEQASSENNILKSKVSNARADRYEKIRELSKMQEYFKMIVIDCIECGKIRDETIDDISSYMKNDTKDFVRNLKIAYEILCPEFIELLNEKELNDTEISICCLLLLGIPWKNVNEVMHRKSCVNSAKQIKTKLGLGESSSNVSDALLLLLRSIYNQ